MMSKGQDLYLENKKINKQEISQGSVILKSRSRRLMFTLTGKCNLSCIMCDRKASNFTLPRNNIEHIVDFFPYLDLIMWQGGEVFLVDYFKELFQEAAHYTQLVQEINTNGLLFNEEWIEIIKNANTRLIFSIDSTRKDIYEHIRRGARFENLIKNISMLNEGSEDSMLKKTVNIVIMRSNYRLLEEFIDFAVRYKFSGLNFLNMIGEICPEENIFQPPDPKALGYLKKTFPSIIEKARSYGIIVSHELTPFLDDNSDACSTQDLSNKEKLFCLMPWASLFIDGSQEGTVYPECLCRKAIGNVFKDSLDEIWNSNDMQIYREKIANNDLENWCNPNCIGGLVNKDFLQNI